MKKRILSAIIMSALVLSMTACGASTDAPEATEGAEVTTTAAAAEEEKTEAETEAPAETEETTTTTEAPKEVLKITDSPSVYFDCMSFKVDGKNYVYNAVDNKMYECDVNKISFALGKMVKDNSGELHNLETKESYDLETGICKESYMYNQYIPVHKKEQNFDGDVTYFGILDKNGEWVLPLSSEYAICKSENFYGAGSATASFAKISVDLLYDYKNDEVMDAFELMQLNPPVYRQFYAISNDKILCYNAASNNYTFYNPNTGEETPVKGSYVYTTPNKTLYFYDYYSDNGYFAIYDENFEMLYEITGYNKSSVWDATENYVVLCAPGADSGYYMIILDKDGNRIVDPISGKAEDFAFITGDYAVVDNQIVNCKTGEIKTCPYYVHDAMVEAGMIIVKNEGEYFLVDPADPETLINPFEIAE